MYLEPLIIKAANGSDGLERVVGFGLSSRYFEGGAKACCIANGTRSRSYHPRCWRIEELEQIKIAPLVPAFLHSSPSIYEAVPTIGDHVSISAHCSATVFMGKRENPGL